MGGGGRLAERYPLAALYNAPLALAILAEALSNHVNVI